MKALSAGALKNLILALDWSGHVELPVSDVEWFAIQLHQILSGSNASVCDLCNTEAIIVVRTQLGTICSNCLEDLTLEVESMERNNR